MKLIDKINNFQVYRYYKTYQRSLLEKGIYPQSDTTLKSLYSKIADAYNQVVIDNNEESESIPGEVLDELAENYFVDLFTGERKLMVRRLINTKIIDESVSMSHAVVDNDTEKIIMKKYADIADIEKLFHEIIHIFIAKTNNPHINSEIISRLFELIIAYEIDDVLCENNYLKKRIGEHIESLKYSLYITSLYPSIDPVIAPYIKADYLANELFLVYLNDPELFTYNLERILSSKIDIDYYLNNSNIVLSEDTISKVLRNHLEYQN